LCTILYYENFTIKGV